MVTTARSTRQQRRSSRGHGEGRVINDRFTVLPGAAHPLGATPTADGVNFSVFSEHATDVTLLLFDEADSAEPIATIELDPRTNKSFHFWHAHVQGAAAGMHYAYRVGGPDDLHGRGHRFNRSKVLIDP